MSETVLEMKINSSWLDIDLVRSSCTLELVTEPVEVIQKGQWGNIGGHIEEQPDLAGYINKVVDAKMNGIKILTITNEGNKEL